MNIKKQNSCHNQEEEVSPPLSSDKIPEENQLIDKENDEDKLARKKLFITACGAFCNGKAQADLSLAQRLYQEGVDVNYADSDGWTALFHACGEGHLSVVEWLTNECNAAIEMRDSDGCTPLWVASFNNRRSVVQHLLLIGADEKAVAQPEGEPKQTPSLAARRNKHPGVADLIDDETALREADPSRRITQIKREMTLEEFRNSLRRVGGEQS